MVKKQNGQYYTTGNPFIAKEFLNWLNLALTNSKNKTILEPFAGEGNIPSLLKEYNLNFDCFDIDEDIKNKKVNILDTIKNFPKGYDITITNPPYLEKSSAKRWNIKYNKSADEERNLYLHCLNLMLDNTKYVAAIIPVSFKLRYKKYIDRLMYVIEYDDEIFFDDTNQEIVLALFGPANAKTDPVFVNKNKSIKIKTLEDRDLHSENRLKISFNDPAGKIGFFAIDSSKRKSKFVWHNEILSEMKVSSRNETKISIKNITVRKSDIEKLNQLLDKYRKDTLDFFTSSFYHNKSKRKRINYKIVRKILEEFYG